MTDLQFSIDTKHQRMSISKDDEVVSFIDYFLKTVAGEPIVTFHYIFTPPAMRGNGWAAIMAKEAFVYAHQQGWTIKATCPYVKYQWQKQKDGILNPAE